MHEQITPVILTYNEENNIDRVLAMLGWANEVLIVDSYSTDHTLEIVSNYPNTRVIKREFDSFSAQWNFALAECGISTPWVLALDADYMLTAGLVGEIDALRPTPGIAGYRAEFSYCVDGVPLRASLYPPVTVLYRRCHARYVQDGHTQRVEVDGDTAALKEPIRHDDRKSITRWKQSQRIYAVQEAAKLKTTRFSALSWRDQVRRCIVVAPVAVPLYALLIRGVVLDGKPGLKYAVQRAYAEGLLAKALLMGKP